jgi:hypothetical protein
MCPPGGTTCPPLRFRFFGQPITSRFSARDYCSFRLEGSSPLILSFSAGMACCSCGLGTPENHRSAWAGGRWALFGRYVAGGLLLSLRAGSWALFGAGPDDEGEGYYKLSELCRLSEFSVCKLIVYSCTG